MDYISKDLAIEYITGASFRKGLTLRDRDAKFLELITHSVIDTIEHIPAADVVPVVHGEWEVMWQKEDPDTSIDCRCSVCKKVSRRPVGDFCKWCGARMDGE